jgi:hypothetical protein
MKKPIESVQIIHEKTVDFLNQFQQFRDSDGNPLLEKFSKSFSSWDVENLTVEQLNRGVVAFLITLNIHAGSAGDYDFYRLLQAYILNKDSRKEFNKLADEKLNQLYERK